MEREGAAAREAAYHAALVSAGAPSLLSSWDTLVYLLPQGLTTISEASDKLAGEIEGSLQQTGNLPAVEDLRAAKAALAETLVTAHGVLDPLPRLSGPVFWVGVAVPKWMDAYTNFKSNNQQAAEKSLALMHCSSKERLQGTGGHSYGMCGAVFRGASWHSPCSLRCCFWLPCTCAACAAAKKRHLWTGGARAAAAPF